VRIGAKPGLKTDRLSVVEWCRYVTTQDEAHAILLYQPMYQDRRFFIKNCMLTMHYYFFCNEKFQLHCCWVESGLLHGSETSSLRWFSRRDGKRDLTFLLHYFRTTGGLRSNFMA